MTCVVGLVHNGDVYIGGDSFSGDIEFRSAVELTPKVFRRSDIPLVLGFSYSWRMGQLLRYELVLEKPPSSYCDPKDWMARYFINQVKLCFKEGDWGKPCKFLVGVLGRLFSIDVDFHVGEIACGYDACGWPQDVARGSLYTTEGKWGCQMEPEKRILMALNAAEYWSGAVRRPFRVVCTKTEGEVVFP